MKMSSIIASSRRHAGLTALLLAPLLLAGCGGSSSGTSVTNSGVCAEFDCPAMLTNLGENIMLPAMEDFSVQSAALEQAALDYQQALRDSGGDEVPQAKNDFQTAWQQAILAWQSVEVMQVGPLVDGPRELRNEIYSWPSTSTCAVDQEVIAAEVDNYDISDVTPLRKGLDALEYLLYTADLNETCPDNVDSVQNWNNRLDSDKRQTRADFAVHVAAGINSRGSELVNAWKGTDGYLAKLSDPEAAGSGFSSAQDAVNTVSDALFYIEKQVKDIKLAEPLGIKGTCDNACPELVENPLSQRSKEHVRQNMVAFQSLFLGNAADSTEARLGFDDLLNAASGENVAGAMETDINATLDEIANLSGSFFAALDGAATGREQIQVIHDKAKKVTDRLKEDFLTVIGLSIPDAAAGDGD
ncbi:MAG: imelysin family protein [Oleiphilaceae bacterium]|nr:imelysin family protein [Oleiphilaceae bacterium]